MVEIVVLEPQFNSFGKNIFKYVLSINTYNSVVRFYMNFFLTQIQRNKLNIDRKRFVLKLIKQNKSKNILEIGVFNGNFALRMLEIAQKHNTEISYTGVDLFSSKFNSKIKVNEVSLQPLAMSDVKEKLKVFNDVKIELHSGYSKEVLPQFIGKKKFDLILIDGGHSYETVKNDWLNSLQLISKNGIIIFDDYSNRRGEKKGGFGIRKLINEIQESMQHEFQIRLSKNRDFFLKDYGLLILQMTLVRKVD